MSYQPRHAQGSHAAPVANVGMVVRRLTVSTEARMALERREITRETFPQLADVMICRQCRRPASAH